MGVDKIVCGDCQSFFPLSRMESFLHHKSTSCEFNQLECSHCSKLFGSLWSLIEHVQEDHDTRIISEEAQEGCCRGDPKGCKPRKKERFCCSTDVSTTMTDAAIQTCQDPLGVRGCEKRSRRSTTKSSDENGRMCCDREECGVSVMPGTHENLKKCCSGVVPKKRKRHIEMKHLHAFKLKKKAMEWARTSPLPVVEKQPLVFNTVADKLSSFNMTSDGQDVNDIISSITGIQEAPPPRTEEEEDDNPDNTNLILDSLMHHFAKTPDALPLISSFLPSPLNPSTVNADMFPPPLQNTEMTIPSPVISCSPSLMEEQPLIGKQNSQKKRQYPTSRPFKCTQCDLSFNQRIHLKKHESKHTGIKPYKCDQCDYATVERSHLRVHMRTHTGEKPYKCAYCDYATAQNSTLKIHQHRHHRNEMGKDPVEEALQSL